MSCKKGSRLWVEFIGMMLCGILFFPQNVGAGPASNKAEAEAWSFLPWDDYAGRIEGIEADSEGPKAFAVKSDGGVFVLDQVNSRVIELNSTGLFLRTLELPGRTFDDIEQYEGWALLALDRLVEKSLLVMDVNGVYLAEIDLKGRGIEHAGSITALLPRSDGVWLEVKHRYSVKVLDRDLQPCERQILLGRPAEGGKSLHGALNGRGGAEIWKDLRNARSASVREVFYGSIPIRRIVWLEEGRDELVYVMFHEALFSPVEPYGVEEEFYRIMVLDGDLYELYEFESPWVLTVYDQRVEFRVGPSGRIWQMAFTPEGVLFLRWNWRR